jgi:hypothetical protein
MFDSPIQKLLDVTDWTFQPARFWSNAAASPNIRTMLLTFAVLQPPMFWLNAAA